MAQGPISPQDTPTKHIELMSPERWCEKASWDSPELLLPNSSPYSLSGDEFPRLHSRKEMCLLK